MDAPFSALVKSMSSNVQFISISHKKLRWKSLPLQQGHKLRTRSAQNIVAEMSHWQDTLGVSLFMFRDPVFSINRRHTVQLCEEIIASGRHFKFIVETHLKNLDEELIQLLKKAGLTMVKVGIESSDTKILGGVKRY